MGRKKNRHRHLSSYGDADGTTEDTVDVLPELHPLDRYLDELFDKREPKRENALMSIIECLRNKVEHKFVEEKNPLELSFLQAYKFATLLYRFLFSIKKGSFKEIHLASYAIGLMAIITNCENYAHEIYEESIPLLNEVLKSKSESPMIFDCLAIVTLFGAKNVDETESTMIYFWEFINPESGSDSVARKYPAHVVAAAISSWSLLLSSMDQWKLSYRYWKGAISCFLNLLEDNAEVVCVAAGEALALIFETGSIEKFSSKRDAEGSTSVQEPLNYAIEEKMVKDKVLKKFEQLSVLNDENSAELNFVQASKGDWDVMQFFKDGDCPEILVTIGKHDLTLSTWSRIVQLKCFMRFLRETAFFKHMLGNELLQDFFDFKPMQRNFSDTELYEPLIDEACVRLYLPPERNDLTNLTSEQIKSMRNARSSTVKKAKSILLKKQRLQAKMRKNDNIFGC